MKKTLIVLLLLFFVLGVPQVALAASEEDQPSYSKVPTVGTPSPYEDYGFSDDSSPYPTVNFGISSASPYFYRVGCQVIKVSNTSIRGMAYTMATQYVDKIGYSLDFQRWNGYKWETLSTVSNYTNNHSKVDSNHMKTITKDNYYRVEVRHLITHNGRTTTKTSTSDYIYIK
ncbi:hypothetical protein NSA47_08750 [Irregularibacter muris]|uniref:F5/8 type C domain-containing protein n=1 Tax=Irregularibacter muris TaxID=1796619 RepID=A0AAE3L2Q8_9FIRM|nr:hypothetical protein [Irregularibacter muris]MCR1899069.1 hypothetical protein [Irregularibacter muris]